LLVAVCRYAPKLQRLTFWLPERRQSATDKPEMCFLHWHSVKEIKLVEGRAVHRVRLRELKHAAGTTAILSITHVHRNFTGHKHQKIISYSHVNNSSITLHIVTCMSECVRGSFNDAVNNALRGEDY